MYSPPTRRKNIFLIGDVDTQIYGNKLPSKLQVLKVLFFNLRHAKLAILESSALVIKEVSIFWEKARLPTQNKYRCVDKLKNLYDEWRNLQKSAGKPYNLEKEEKFTSSLQNLFDIAHGNIEGMIDETGKEFLVNQRADGRIGYISNVETIYDAAEKAQLLRVEILSARLAKAQKERERLENLVDFASSREASGVTLSQQSAGTFSNASFEDPEPEAGPSQPKKRRGTVNVVTEKVVTALDKCIVTDRNAVHLMITIAQALHYDVDSLIVNRSSIRRCRQTLRETRAKKIKEVFTNTELNSIVLHWDGKILPNLLKREVHDRLPVVMTNGDVEQLLGVPELENSTGISQAQAIYEVLDDWGLRQNAKALCCDTTASNLGHINGAAVQLERMLERSLLYLPCRHHIYELVLKSVFEAKMPSSSGPNIPLLKRFQNSWNKLDQTKYKPGLQNENVKKILIGHVEDINNFVEETLKTEQPRDDYEELLDLTKIFLGVVPADEVKFRFPGPFHHARWMAKAIYCLKIYLFREEFRLTAKEETSLSEICTFIVLIYVEAWYTAPRAPQAPNHDLQFLLKLDDYKYIDDKISEATLKKFKNHSWYINPEISAMAFFDEDLSIDMKRKMISEIKTSEDSDEDCFNRVEINLKDINNLHEKQMDSFVTAQTLKFFERFEISKEFLEIDPAMWSENPDFQAGLKVVKVLKVVNDTAERAVHLMESYNNVLTRNEDQKQYILQVTSEYRKKIRDSTKQEVMKDF